MSEISLPENLIIEDISEHQAKLVFFWDPPIKKPMHCCRCLESQDHHQNRMCECTRYQLVVTLLGRNRLILKMIFLLKVNSDSVRVGVLFSMVC